MKIMVLNDGETFTSIKGCRIVEVNDTVSDDAIEEHLEILSRYNVECVDSKIIGEFDENGNFIVGDPRFNGDKTTLKLE